MNSNILRENDSYNSRTFCSISRRGSFAALEWRATELPALGEKLNAARTNAEARLPKTRYALGPDSTEFMGASERGPRRFSFNLNDSDAHHFLLLLCTILRALSSLLALVDLDYEMLTVAMATVWRTHEVTMQMTTANAKAIAAATSQWPP